MKNYFSVIIPTLNEEKYLPKLLGDLARQNDGTFEVLVVDGNSDDETKKMAKSFSKLFPFSFFENQKRNVAYQRNFGASKANGDYLFFLDADSRLTANFIKKLKNEIEKKKGLLFLPAVAPEKNNYQDKLMFNITNSLVDLSQKIGNPFSSGGSMIVQKDFFGILGGFNEKLFISEDHELIQRAFEYGVNAKLLTNIKIKVCLRRMEKEGRLKYLLKYLVAAVETFNKGKIEKKIFRYEMGGAGYPILKDKDKSIDKILQEYFKKMASQVKSLINE